MGKRTRIRGQFVRLSPLGAALFDYLVDREPGSYKADIWSLAIRAFAVDHPLWDRDEFFVWCRKTLTPRLDKIERDMLEKELEIFDVYLKKGGALSDIRELDISSRLGLFKLSVP